MFILALILGPAIGIFVGDLVMRSWRIRPALILALMAIALIIISVVPIALEVKVGITLGFALGMLLTATPVPAEETTSAET